METTETTKPTKPMKDAASDFLAHKRIAVTGVSRNPKGHGSNVVYQRPARPRLRGVRRQPQRRGG